MTEVAAGIKCAQYFFKNFFLFLCFLGHLQETVQATVFYFVVVLLVVVLVVVIVAIVCRHCFGCVWKLVG